MNKNDNHTNPAEDVKARDEATAKKVADEKATTDNLDGGEDAKDALGVKKNVVGPNRDEKGPDNSPTINDVSQDQDQVLEDAKREGIANHRAETEQA